jgi:nascent polypeptide-associated complex subunit beta
MSRSSFFVSLGTLNPLYTVQSALPANTLAITGHGQTKELTELVPGILNQLGPDSLANLRRLAESYQSMTARQAAAAAAAGGAGAGEKKEGEVGDDEDDIPDLVENFEEAEGKAAAGLEDLE